MANFAAQQRHVARAGSHGGLSTEWDVVSEGALSHERFSTGSLSSEESDAVIIFDGRKNRASTLSRDALPLSPSPQPSPAFGGTSNAAAALAAAGACAAAKSAALQAEDPSPADTLARRDAEPWQQRHQRLLSAVSDLASDPGLNRVNADIYGGLEQSMPIEQRLLDQIAKLAEELDDSQEQAKLLLLQNDRLMSENDQLRHALQDGGRAGERRRDGEGEDERPDVMRVTIAVAAGIVIIGLAKKRLMFNGVGIVGAAVLGGCMGVYQFVNKLQQHTGKDDY